MPTIAERMAGFALDVTPDDVPPEVLAQAVRLVADTLACGLGAVDGEAPRILRAEALHRARHAESTLLGTRKPKIHVPIPLMKALAAAMEALLPHPPVTRGQLDLLEIDNVTAPNPLPALFGIERPAYLQAKLDYIRR